MGTPKGLTKREQVHFAMSLPHASESEKENIEDGLLQALLFECDSNTDELDSVRKEWMSKIADAAERLRPRTKELMH